MNATTMSHLPHVDGARQDVRGPYRERVHLRAPELIEGETRELSYNGVGLVLASPLKTGSAVDVIFINNSVFVQGIVSRCEPTDKGYSVCVAFLQEEREVVDVIRLTRPLRSHA